MANVMTQMSSDRMLDTDNYCKLVLTNLGRQSENTDFLEKAANAMSTIRAQDALRVIRQYFDGFHETIIGSNERHILPSTVGLPQCLDRDYTVPDVQQDGNCYFRSINKLISGKDESINCLRFLAMDVALHPAFWYVATEYVGSNRLETVKRCTLIVDKFEKITSGSWANESVALALSVGLQWNIQIISTYQKKWNSNFRDFRKLGLFEIHHLIAR